MKKKAVVLSLMIMMMGACLMVSSKAKAAGSYKYGTFAITALTDTSVSIDYRNVYYSFTELNGSVSKHDVYIQDDTLMTDRILFTSQPGNCVYGTITGLTPGHTYTIWLYSSYDLPYTGSGEDVNCVTFTTPSSGIDGNVDVVDTSDGTINTTTPTPPTTPSVYVPAPVVQPPVAPMVTKVKMSGSTVGINTVPVVCSGLEYGLFDRSGKLIKKEDTTSGILYNISRRRVYMARCRAYTYDSDYNKVYSDWGSGKYVVPQPTISKSKSKLKPSYVKLKWSKVSGAKTYTIYMRKTNTKKWYKVKTVKSSKTSLKITKFRGRKANFRHNNYDITVKANAKLGGKNYSSGTQNYIYTYFYYR